MKKIIVINILVTIMILQALGESEESLESQADQSEDTTTTKIHAVTATLNKMLTNYDKRIRPDFDGPPVDIGITIFVKSVSSVSEVDMELKFDFYLRQYWKDGRLKFNLTRKRSGTPLQVIGLSHEFSHQIWQPDTFFPNEKRSYIHSATVQNEFIRLYPNGTILKSTRLTLTASCPMNLVYFPMDKQNCAVELGSYGYSISDIMYHWFQNETSVRIGFNSLTLPQFRILGHRQNTRMSRTTTGQYKILFCEFLMVRSLNYYLTQVYIPAALIVVISWFSLWMGRDVFAERMALGVTSVLTITTLLMSTSSNSPKISYVKALDIYLAVCFTLVFASLLQSSCVGYLFKKLKAQEAKKEEKRAKMAKIFDAEKENLDADKKRGQWRESLSFELDQGDIEFGERSKGQSEIKGKEFKCQNKLNYMVRIATIDIIARFIFPLGFSAFNVIYWIYYLNAMRGEGRDESWVYSGWG